MAATEERACGDSGLIDDDPNVVELMELMDPRRWAWNENVDASAGALTEDCDGMHAVVERPEDASILMVEGNGRWYVYVCGGDAIGGQMTEERQRRGKTSSRA